MTFFRHFRFGILSLGLIACAALAGDPTPEERLKAEIAPFELKAKNAAARVAKFEQDADSAKSNADRTRLLKEARVAREEASIARQNIQYIETRHLELKFNEMVSRMNQLMERAAKIDSDDARAPVVREMNELRSQAIDVQKKVRRSMDELAPSDRQGFGPAHLWQADLILRGQQSSDGRLVPPSRAQLMQAERHFIQAAESSEPDVRAAAQVGLARVYYDTNRKGEAAELVVRVAANRPEYHMLLAQWAARDGRKDELAAHAQSAANYFLERIRARADDHPARFSYVDALILLQKYDDAKAELLKAAAAVENPQLKRSYRAKTAAIVLGQLDARGQGVSINDRLAAYNEALQSDPENQEVFGRLVMLAQAGGPDADKARDAMQKLTADSSRAVLAHLYLGYDSFRRKDEAGTRRHWEKAHELSKGAPVVSNNLAWNLATSEPVDLKRALSLIEDALTKIPNEPRFRSTRGQILIRLERYREALPDLLAATQVYGNDPNLFRMLSNVVLKLGDRRKAEEFAKRAEALAAEAARKAQPPPKPQGP